jgi:hypothetical protein
MNRTNLMPKHLGLPLFILWTTAQGLALLSAHAATSSAESNLTAVNTTGQAPPDLAVEAVSFSPASVNAGGTVNVSFRARNVGGWPSLPVITWHHSTAFSTSIGGYRAGEVLF